MSGVYLLNHPTTVKWCGHMVALGGNYNCSLRCCTHYYIHKWTHCSFPCHIEYFISHLIPLYTGRIHHPRHGVLIGMQSSMHISWDPPHWTSNGLSKIGTRSRSGWLEPSNPTLFKAAVNLSKVHRLVLISELNIWCVHRVLPSSRAWQSHPQNEATLILCNAQTMLGVSAPGTQPLDCED